ncbi:chromosome partitioning protein ParA [Longibacter salinarum]|uniref:Chromosome partitioning protein ParA n=1 Tax=Longibacter salinarum TaxID=1850348 RepID=A0A2A8D0Z4_9BACT|nr:AAA family ATPase [Longibacter salinarum]PEN14605.1 chromosome partitioning protein ParA [Longibacter salinarum]
MIKTIPIINNKGGVGKTTTTINVASGLVRNGKRVLVIDLDSQGSASLAMGVDRDQLNPSSADVLFGDIEIEDAIRSTKTPDLDLITGSLRLADTDTRLSRQPNREKRLSNAIERVEDEYDVVLIDCAPSTSLLSVNALVAADAFIIPVSPSYLSLEGVISLGQVVKNVRLSIGEAAPVLGVVLTMVKREDEQTRAIINEVRGHYGGKVFNTEIRDDPAIENAPAFGKSVFDSAPDSRGATDYAALVDEIIERIDRYGSIYGTVRRTADDREKHTDASDSKHRMAS